MAAVDQWSLETICCHFVFNWSTLVFLTSITSQNFHRLFCKSCCWFHCWKNNLKNEAARINQGELLIRFNCTTKEQQEKWELARVGQRCWSPRLKTTSCMYLTPPPKKKRRKKRNTHTLSVVHPTCIFCIVTHVFDKDVADNDHLMDRVDQRPPSSLNFHPFRPSLLRWYTTVYKYC